LAEKDEIMSPVFEIALDIPNVKIDRVETNKESDFIITVSSTLEGTHCRKCGKRICKFHGHDDEITLRHLPILGRKVYLRIQPARYQCLDCDGRPTTTQRLSWYKPKSPHTKAYERHILLSLVNSTVSDVAIKEDLGYEAVMGIINRYILEEVDWNEFRKLGILGLDEISLKKGHKDFVTIVTCRDGEQTHILGVLKDRKKTTVKQFLLSIPKRLRKTICAVCSDMYEGFINAVKEVLKGVKIVIDRFHAAKLYRSGMDNLRKQELKRLKKELPEEEYKKLKGTMWILRKREENLSEADQKVLDCLFKHSPMLKLAYELCYELTGIFDKDISKDTANREIKNWMRRVKKSNLSCFDSFLKTLGTWMHEITNYFIDRHSSGFVEGLNNKIKVIKRRCYGILNVRHLFQRIYLDLLGYSLFL
jgi:transposase